MSSAPYEYSSLEGIEGKVSVSAYVARQKWSYVFDADTYGRNHLSRINKIL